MAPAVIGLWQSPMAHLDLAGRCSVLFSSAQEIERGGTFPDKEMPIPTLEGFAALIVITYFPSQGLSWPVRQGSMIETGATILIALLIGAAIAVPITYYVTLDRKRVRVLEEQREINRDKVWRETYDSFLNDLRVEQQVSVAQQKVLFLTQREMVINERLYYRHIPLSGWIEHRRLMDTELNGEELIKAAQYASLLTLPGKTAGVSTKLVKALLKKAS